MASRAKAAIGSAEWVKNERAQSDLFIEQDAEEFVYAVRNELEWLNEHMSDIFTKGTVNFADVFKTPGKLRGKTPRTARKINDGPARQPLTDVFGPSVQHAPTPAKPLSFLDKVAHFQIAEDVQQDAQEQRPTSRSKSPQRLGKPGNTDSGYHGMTEDEMEVDGYARAEGSTQPSQGNEAGLSVHDNVHDEALPSSTNATAIGHTSGEESFVSATEGMSTRNAPRTQLQAEQDSDTATVPDEEVLAIEVEQQQDVAMEDEVDVLDEHEHDTNVEDALDNVDEVADSPSSHQSSSTSSPAKLLQRKSSFTFSALPAREPLTTTKRSIGFRESVLDAQNRNSVLGRSLGKSFGLQQADDDSVPNTQSEEARLHGKTSAQLLHERISMLGKTREPRPSKSIPQAAAYPQLPDEVDNAKADVHSQTNELAVVAASEDDDDDWIAPTQITAPMLPQRALTHAPPPARPIMHQKSASTTQIASPARQVMGPPESRHQKAMSVADPRMAPVLESTTPIGSPTNKKHPEAPMSASKKLWTAFKSARNLFASSAGSSAAAKLEAHSQSPAVNRKQQRDFSGESKTAAIVNMPGALYSETQFVTQSPSRPVSVISASPSRKTRSSAEGEKKREKEAKAQQKAANEFEKAREKERAKAAKAQEEKDKADAAAAAKRQKTDAALAQRRVSADKDREDMPPPPPPKSMLPAGKSSRMPGRLVRPTRDVASKAKPAPMNIRVASQSQRVQAVPSQPSFQREESLAPAPPPKTGLRTISAQSTGRSSTMPQNPSRLKALEAAARKKEVEEREKQRKADQRREMERKRAAKAEEDRRVEQERKAEEQRKLQEVKMAAQKQAERQAAEAKRREQARLEQQQRAEQQKLDMQRLEQQRQQEAAEKAKAAHELAEAIQRERAQQSAPQRGDVGGTLRQLGQKLIQPNTAKPPKRALQDEDEQSQQQQVQRPGLQRGPLSYQQTDAKRRKTNEEEPEVEHRHSVMAPPKRPSTMRKDTLTKFPHGYSHAPPPAQHHPGSMFKSAVSSQHQSQQQSLRPPPAHPSQTVQLSNARIPFAENNNPPAASHQQMQPQSHHPGNENFAPKYKTPAPNRTATNPKSAQPSPAYPAGDSIALPEIMTDSEDDSDADDDATSGFRAPSWVASPALRDLLTQQQLVDPETVFGPIAELRMEEVFKGGNKNVERVKKFRERGSSAMWVESGDAVTSAEKRRDKDARERVAREGGWRYDVS
nr:hypothetical protein B0A51_09451 [Rachicladosporium sp. CCFEE 5018]